MTVIETGDVERWKPVKMVYTSRSGANAHAYGLQREADGAVAIVEGSTLISDDKDSCPVIVRADLLVDLRAGRITAQPDRLIRVVAPIVCVYRAPSAAAEYVGAASLNGNAYWLPDATRTERMIPKGRIACPLNVRRIATSPPAPTAV